jgi:hypothetical protein
MIHVDNHGFPSGGKQRVRSSGGLEALYLNYPWALFPFFVFATCIGFLAIVLWLLKQLR